MKDRRFFLKSSLLATASLTVPSVANELQGSTSLSPLNILKVVQLDLFPQDAVENANAFAYLSVILNHSLVSKDDKQYLRNGARWINEEAVSKYNTSYIALNSKQRQKVLQMIAKESWGRSWIRRVLNYIMEASLGDPVYGINKNESGWKWLGHTPGSPRPKEALL